MTDVSSGGNINLEITPANTLSNGKISFKGGAPVIQFIIGEQERLLIGKSVRLCGQFRIQLDSNNNAASVPTSLNDGAELCLPARLGMYACIDQLVIKSQETHQVIEHIRHYSRFAASYLPVTNALSDSLGHMGESSLTMPNYQLSQNSVVFTESNRTTGNQFCISLPCGLFNGVQDIPLSAEWGLRGLLVEIHLAPDANVLFTKDAAAAAFTDAFYELSNVKLVAEAVNPTPQMVKQMGSTFEYNSISSYFSSINSSNPIINFQLGMRRVLGVFVNFLASSNINSLLFDGTATQPLINEGAAEVAPADINQVIFTRGGTRFPLEYNIDTIQKEKSLEGIQVVDAELMRQYLNSVKSFANLRRSMVSTRNTWLYNNATPAGRILGNQLQADKTAVEGGNNFGVGIAYDTISGDGVDFSTLNWGLQMDCGLSTNRPHACYVFVHSKNTLVFNQTGLQVVN
jgi:hypothetical protein